MIGSDSVELNDMISDLEKQRKAAETLRALLQRQLAAAVALYDELASAYVTFTTERELVLHQAKEKAKLLVDKAQKKADKIIKQRWQS